MDRKLVGWVLATVGTVLVLVSALADRLGVGSEGTGFGWKQIAGIAVGVVVALAGLWLAYSRGARVEASTEPEPRPTTEP